MQPVVRTPQKPMTSNTSLGTAARPMGGGGVCFWWHPPSGTNSAISADFCPLTSEGSPATLLPVGPCLNASQTRLLASGFQVALEPFPSHLGSHCSPSHVHHTGLSTALAHKHRCFLLTHPCVLALLLPSLTASLLHKEGGPQRYVCAHIVRCIPNRHMLS